ncbi:GNAT family N-acetyltransferase [Vampirovibrio chlorellavorus]|uniref:GNAT family N-acetyltransferase n=1 Tax=Vampirovibrio chlorellavorus TaxID=758823 RepID=UPI0026E98DE8|nr:GNAT family N-acetyltransferase [Vampirovibrio chlorellavorus]
MRPPNQSKVPQSSSILKWRLAQVSDQGDLCRLISAMALESENRQLHAETLAAGVLGVFEQAARGTYWVLCFGEVAVGCTLITSEWSDWNNATYWWIQSLYIEPDYRGQGGFESLLIELEQAAQVENVPELRLYVEQHNQRAQRVYLRNGFEGQHYRCMTKTISH